MSRKITTNYVFALILPVRSAEQLKQLFRPLWVTIFNSVQIVNPYSDLTEENFSKIEKKTFRKISEMFLPQPVASYDRASRRNALCRATFVTRGRGTISGPGVIPIAQESFKLINFPSVKIVKFQLCQGNLPVSSDSAPDIVFWTGKIFKVLLQSINSILESSLVQHGTVYVTVTALHQSYIIFTV